MEVKNNDYIKRNNTNNSLRNYHSEIPSKYKTINIDNNNVNNNINIKILKERIKSQKADINYLKDRLKNYDETINEVTRLNSEINKLNDIIKNKNKTIQEYRNISEIAKKKI